MWLEISKEKWRRDDKEEKLKISAKFPGKSCPTEKKNNLCFKTYFTLNNKQIPFADNYSELFLELVNILIFKQNHRTLSSNLK